MNSKFVSTNETVADVAEFKGVLTSFVGSLGEGPEQSFIWAAYPFSPSNSTDGKSVNLHLPADQVTAPGAFDKKALLTLARSNSFYLSFFHVCGGIRFKVETPGIRQVELRGNRDEYLAGDITVSMDDSGHPLVLDVTSPQTCIRLNAPAGDTFRVGQWYYLVCLPIEFKEGFTLSFKGKVQRGLYTHSEGVSVKRAVWGSLDLPDRDAVWEEVPSSSALLREDFHFALERRYNSMLTNDKRFVAIGFDDFRSSDFSSIIPMFDRFGFRATFNRITFWGSLAEDDRQVISDHFFSGTHEMGDHTFRHFSFPFNEPLFNGQDPAAPDGDQKPFPTNDDLRKDCGNGRNVFGFDLTAPVESCLGYQAPPIQTPWGSMSDEECQFFRSWFSVMKDVGPEPDRSNLILLLDELSNRYLGTSGSSPGSWNSELGQYTGGIFTGCKTSANHEIWERYLEVMDRLNQELFGPGFSYRTWSWPGSKMSFCYYSHGGKLYYDSSHTVFVNNLAKMPSSLYQDASGNPKWRSWTDVLREHGYYSTHDAIYPGRVDGQPLTAMGYQFFFNESNSRKDALAYPTNRQVDYSQVAGAYPETFFSGSRSRAAQMYDDRGEFFQAIERWRTMTANGVIWGEVIDSAGSFSEQVFFEELLRYCKVAGIELITKQEAMDICFNYKRETGNLIYNPDFWNSAKEFLPDADVPSNPDGYTGDCYVDMDPQDGLPVLYTTTETVYNHFGVPLGNLLFSAEVEGHGMISFKFIRNRSGFGLNDLETVSTVSIENDDRSQVESLLYVPNEPIQPSEQLHEGLGDKIIGLQIVYSPGLSIKSVSLTKTEP